MISGQFVLLMAVLVPALPLGFEQQLALHILGPRDIVFGYRTNERTRLTAKDRPNWTPKSTYSRLCGVGMIFSPVRLPALAPFLSEQVLPRLEPPGPEQQSREHILRVSWRS